MSSNRYNLNDVYHAAKHDRNFDYVFWMHVTLDILTDKIVIYGSFLLVLFAIALIAVISIIGFFVLLPTIATPWTLYFIVHVLWGNLSIMLLLHYLIINNH